MKPYSVDLREKVVSTYHSGNISVRKLAVSFGVGKAFVQKMLRQQKEEGHVNPGKQGTKKKAVLADFSERLISLVEKHPDATLSEYCEYWLELHHQVVSKSMMCRALQKLNLTRKKKRFGAVRELPTEFSSSDVNTGIKLEI
jgi:transposase